MTRSEVEGAFQKLGAPLAAGDIDGWCERFAPDCSFVNSQLTEPVIGREALRAMAREWPKVDNRPEWIAIDGNRVVMCWNECVVSEEMAWGCTGIRTAMEANGLALAPVVVGGSDALQRAAVLAMRDAAALMIMKFDEQTLFTSLGNPSTLLPAVADEEGAEAAETQAIVLGGSSNE